MSPAADRDLEDGSAVRAFVASKHGITRIEVVDGEVRGYALVHECTARDLAATADGRIVVGTQTDVLFGDGQEFEGSGFGSAVAVGGDPVLAASPNGDIAGRIDGAWQPIGSLPASVTAIDGDLVATEDGVFRVTDGGIQHVGLDQAADVSTAGVPYAATASGLFKLGAGWMSALEGEFHLVTADPRTAEPGVVRRAHAATPEQLFVYDGDEWGPWHIPVDSPVVGIGYDQAVFALSEDGTLISARDGEWRTRSLGLSGITGLLVKPEENA